MTKNVGNIDQSTLGYDQSITYNTPPGIVFNFTPTVDNSQTEILALNHTNGDIVIRNNIVDTVSTQTVTNKSIDSGSNTVTITSGALSGININSVVNQYLTSTSTPQFYETTFVGAAALLYSLIYHIG